MLDASALTELETAGSAASSAGMAGVYARKNYKRSQMIVLKPGGKMIKIQNVTSKNLKVLEENVERIIFRNLNYMCVGMGVCVLHTCHGVWRSDDNFQESDSLPSLCRF